jgi:prepilin-type N-terminal cleavage/methylation domain-containing protein
VKSKKGFTLIELLAIIVILAIIAVITVPIILNVIENSKKGAIKDSALGFMEAIQKYYVSDLMNKENEELPSGIKLVSMLPDDFEVSGEKPSLDSWVELEKGQVVAYSLKFGDYVVTKYKNSDMVCEKGNVWETEEIRTIRLAQEAVIESANLYVKAAITKYSFLTDETVKTVSEMTSDELVKPDDLNATGWIRFNVESNTVSVSDYSLKFGDYVANYSSLTSGNYVSSVVQGSERNKPVIVTVGSEICYGSSNEQECFKVIKTDSNKTLLFANYNLKKYTDNSTVPATVTYKQESSSPDSVSFSASNYWDNSGLKSEYAKDINNNSASYSGNPYPYVYNLQGTDTNNVKPYVDGYVSNLKTATYGLPSSITGRLLTYEEADNTSMFVDNVARKNGKDYWLGSSYNNINLWIIGFDGYINLGSIYVSSGGVRPVIEISTSDIQ